VNSLQLQTTNVFLSKFQLTDNEAQILQAGEIDQHFFSALLSLRRISTDRQQLMKVESYSNLCFEIADQISEIEKIAYDRLYRWTKTAIAALGTENAEVSRNLQSALSALQMKEAVYQHCIAEIERVRSSVILNNFLVCLQKGGTGGMPRPIELSVSDPIRYVGDMLAVIHALIASESEMWNLVFEEKEQRERIAANISSVLCTPFYDRVLRVIESCMNILTLFQISNLFFIYAIMLNNFLSQSSPFHVIFDLCKEACMKQIQSILQQQMDNLLLSPPIPPSNCSPPIPIHDHLKQISNIIKSIDVKNNDQTSEREKYVQLILTAVVDPITQICQLSATGLDEARMSVFLLNCLMLLSSSLNVCADCESAKRAIEKLSIRIEAQLEIAVQSEGRHLIRECKLEYLWTMMGPYLLHTRPMPSIKLSEVEGLECDRILNCIRDFESSLFTNEIHQMSILSKIIDENMQQKAKLKAVDAVVNSYNLIYEALQNSANGYGDSITGMIRYSPDQIRAILTA
jgi:conserved oligomeric Golgi complex subunit 6